MGGRGSDRKREQLGDSFHMCFARGSLASPTRGPVLLSYSSSSSIKEGQEVRMFMVSTLSCGCLAVSQSEGSCPRFTFKLDFCRIQYTPPCFSWILQKHSTLFFNPYLTNTLFSYCLFAISSIAILSYSRTLCIVMGLLLNHTLHLQYY